MFCDIMLGDPSKVAIFNVMLIVVILNVVAPVESQLDELGDYSQKFLSYYFIGMCKPKHFDRN
jgi:hypothetical protein